jgi:hypothetical protein
MKMDYGFRIQIVGDKPFISRVRPGTDDDYVRQHVAGQRWYEPRKNFTIENLTKTQKAVLSQIDARIQNAKETQSSSSRK